MMQAPFLNIPDVRDHPARLLLLSEVGLLPPHDGIRRIGRSNLSRAVEVRRTSFLGLTRSHRPRGTPPPAWRKLSRQTRAELYAAIGLHGYAGAGCFYCPDDSSGENPVEVIFEGWGSPFELAINQSHHDIVIPLSPFTNVASFTAFKDENAFLVDTTGLADHPRH